MLSASGDPKNRERAPFILSALKQFGETALLPMVGAVRNDGTVVQAIAISVLSAIESPVSTDALCRAAISSRVPASAREIARSTLNMRGLATRDDIERRIFSRGCDYLEGKIPLPSDSNGKAIVWNWNYDQKRLVSTTISKRDAAKYLSVDLTRDLYQLHKYNADYRNLHTISVLEATKRVIGPNRKVLAQEVSSYVDNLTSLDLDRALGDALEKDLIAAATGAAEVLGQIGDAGLVSATNGQYRNLVKAVVAGNRHLQFAATQAITQLLSLIHI